MRTGNYGSTAETPWRKMKEAQAYFRMGRNALDRLAVEAGAKKKVGERAVLYNIRAIEKYISGEEAGR